MSMRNGPNGESPFYAHADGQAGLWRISEKFLLTRQDVEARCGRWFASPGCMKIWSSGCGGRTADRDGCGQRGLVSDHTERIDEGRRAERPMLRMTSWSGTRVQLAHVVSAAAKSIAGLEPSVESVPSLLGLYAHTRGPAANIEAAHLRPEEASKSGSRRARARRLRQW